MDAETTTSQIALKDSMQRLQATNFVAAANDIVESVVLRSLRWNFSDLGFLEYPELKICAYTHGHHAGVASKTADREGVSTVAG